MGFFGPLEADEVIRSRLILDGVYQLSGNLLGHMQAVDRKQS